MSIHNILESRVDVRWDARLIIISDRASFEAVHTAIKSSFFYRSKFSVPMLNHTVNGTQLKLGAPELKRLVLDEGWKIIGEDHIIDAIVLTNTFTSKNGVEVTHLVIEKHKRDEEKLIA